MVSNSTRWPRRGGWGAKFAAAGRGIYMALRQESSFRVHIPVAAAVVVCGAVLAAEPWQWCILLLCTGIVLAAEMFNTSLERLARAVDERPNPLVSEALDVASGAVLVAAGASALVGMIVFLPAIWSS